MKISVALFVILSLSSCSEKRISAPESTVKTNEIKDSSIEITHQMSQQNSPNSGRMAALRRVEGDTVFRSVQAGQLPLSISENIDSEKQRFILEIENFEGGEIEAVLIPEHGEQNIRFKQVVLDGKPVGGPYGKTLREKVSRKGRLEIVVGKNLMAEGNISGGFRVDIK